MKFQVLASLLEGHLLRIGAIYRSNTKAKRIGRVHTLIHMMVDRGVLLM